MQINDAYKPLGILSVAIIWFAFIYMLRRWGSYKHKTLSQHAVSNKRVFAFYTSMVFIALVLFGLFIYKWFIPELNLSILFKALVTLCIFGEFIAITIPDVGGLKTNIHNISAYGVGLLLPIVVSMIALSTQVSTAAKCVSVVAIITMLVLSYLFYINRKSQNNYLLYQCAYYGCFHLSILSAVYLS